MSVLADNRYNISVGKSRADQNAWKLALQLLEASRQKITITKSGPNKGVVRGIPEKIKPAIAQLLVKIVHGEEPVELQSSTGDKKVSIDQVRYFQKRRWRDGFTAILAAMYSTLKSSKTLSGEKEICRLAREYCDSPMQFDHRVRQRGAWESMKNLIKYNIVQRERLNGFGSCFMYYLTTYGLKFCYALFTRKFHPSIDHRYPEIRSRHVIVHEDGTVTPIGLNAAAVAVASRDHHEVLHGTHRHDNRVRYDHHTLHSPSPYLSDIGSPLSSHHNYNSKEEDGWMDYTPSSYYAPSSCPPSSPSYTGPTPDKETLRALRLSKFDTIGRSRGSNSSRCIRNKSHMEGVKGSVGVHGGVTANQMDGLVGGGDKQLNEDLDRDLDLAIALSMEGWQAGEETSEKRHDEENETEIVLISPPRTNTHNLSSRVNPIKRKQKDTEIEIISFASSSEIEEKEREEREDSQYSTKRRRTQHQFEVLSSTPTPRVAVNTSSVMICDLTGDASSGDRSGGKGKGKGKRRKVPANDGDGVMPQRLDINPVAVDLTSSSPPPPLPRCRPAARSPLLPPPPPSQERDLNGDTNYEDESSLPLSGPFTSIHPSCNYTFMSIHPSCNYTLWVDSNERKRNDRYREFFHSIKKNTQDLMPTYQVIETALPLGDFVCMKSDNDRGFPLNKDSKTASFDFIVERKTISDIVTRSAGNGTKGRWSFEGPHVRQVRHLRYCGIQHPFILIEGDIKHPLVQIGPRVMFDNQSGPDVIRGSFDIINFLSQVITQGWGRHHVHVIQTGNDIKSALLLTVMSCFFRFWELSINSDPIRRNQRYKQGSVNCTPTAIHWRQSSEESNLDSILSRIGIDDEVAARIHRRFGSARVLSEVLSEAAKSGGEHASTVLHDLTADCSHSGWGSILGRQHSFDSDGESEDEGEAGGEKGYNTLLLSRSQVRAIHQMIQSLATTASASASASAIIGIEGEKVIQLHRYTDVIVDGSMEALLSITGDANAKVKDSFPANIRLVLHGDSLLESGTSAEKSIADISYAHALVSSPHRAETGTAMVIRRSQPTHLLVLRGDVLIEALVQARVFVGPPPCPYSEITLDNMNVVSYFHRLIEITVINFLQPLLPAEVDITPNKASFMASRPQNYVLILENLAPLASNTGAINRLRTALRDVENARLSANPSAAGRDKPVEGSSSVQLRKGRMSLNAEAAKDIDFYFDNILFPFLLVYLNTECQCYVLQSKGPHESEEWVSALIPSIHDNALLLL